MADATYENDLVLCTTWFKHDALARKAVVTYALFDGDSNLSAQAWADAMQAEFVASFKSQVDATCVIEKTTTIKGDGTAVTTAGESSDSGTRGLVNANSLASNSAVLVRKRTGLSGRENRGRMYFPWSIGESAVSEIGLIETDDLESFQESADMFLSDINAFTGSATMVIANRVYSDPWTDPNRELVAVNVGAIVTSLKVDPYIATQRRRLVRG